MLDWEYYTGKGASASIDMTLAVIGEIGGDDLAKTTQLFIEYNPNPPVHSKIFNKILSSKIL